MGQGLGFDGERLRHRVMLRLRVGWLGYSWRQGQTRLAQQVICLVHAALMLTRVKLHDVCTIEERPGKHDVRLKV